ncbi:MAG: hypothetical protein LBU00_00225 [Treponema sp.]|jgi:hypothetical protein|nr:hypothetical protein [Treponema sp.]
MTIEQIVDIPEFTTENPVVLKLVKGQKPLMELCLPPDMPVGKARVEVTLTPEKTRLIKRETGETLCGAAKGLKLTLERFMEIQREDIDLENNLDEQLWGNKK